MWQKIISVAKAHGFKGDPADVEAVKAFMVSGSLEITDEAGNPLDVSSYAPEKEAEAKPLRLVRQ